MNLRKILSNQVQMRKILWKQVQTRKITSSNLETNLAFHIYFTILANTRGLSGGFSAEKGGKIDIETMVILDETKTSRRKSVTDGKDTPGTGKIDGKKSLGTGKTDRKRKVISAPEKNTESSASKKTRIETISSLSSFFPSIFPVPGVSFPSVHLNLI